MVARVDPIPDKAYAVLAKTGEVAGDPVSIQRFSEYPGVKTLAEHPKIRALRDDPDIMREVKAKNYNALLINEHIVEALNDPEVYELVKKVDLDKALSHALVRTDSPQLIK